MCNISKLWPVLQLMSPSGKADFLSAEGDVKDLLWKAVRRGVAPAFGAKALRCYTAVVVRCNILLLSVLTNQS